MRDLNNKMKITAIAAQRSYQVTLLLVAAAAGLTYASFPLAFWLNAQFALHGEVSDLGQAGQPHASLFNGLDITSGILLSLLCVLLLIMRRGNMNRSWRWAVQTLLFSGIGTILAALLPLPVFFVYPTSVHAFLHISRAVFEHGFASFVNTCAFIISTLLWARIIRRHQKPSHLRLVLAYSIIGLVCLGPIASFIFPAIGPATQRIFISLFAIWVIIFTYDALQTAKDKDKLLTESS